MTNNTGAFSDKYFDSSEEKVLKDNYSDIFGGLGDGVVDREAESPEGFFTKRFNELLSAQQEEEARILKIRDSLDMDIMAICRDVAKKNKELALLNDNLKSENWKYQRENQSLMGCRDEALELRKEVAKLKMENCVFMEWRSEALSLREEVATLKAENHDLKLRLSGGS